MKIICSALIFLGYFTIYAQTVGLPPIPEYDSVFVEKSRGHVLRRVFYLDGQKVFEAGYKPGNTLYSPFSQQYDAKEDSCYAYFTGKARDVYYFGPDYIKNEKFSESGNILKYHKFTYSKKTIEKGDYYMMKDVSSYSVINCPRYRIGKWKLETNDNNLYAHIDYDKLLIDGKKLSNVFRGEKQIILKLKRAADKKLRDVYGRTFIKNHVQFNLSLSRFTTRPDPHLRLPFGTPLLNETKDKILYVDLVYDIIIGEYRSDVIKLRISREGEFFGRTSYKFYPDKYFFLAQGLDKQSNGQFHEDILDWENTAKGNGFHTDSRHFNVKFDWVYQEGLFGELKFVIEEDVKVKDPSLPYTGELRRLYINAWTGEKTMKKLRYITESIDR